MVSYYLRTTNKSQNSINSLTKILDYLMSFVGDIEITKETDISAILYYIGTPNSAYIRLEKDGEIVVEVPPDDTITISLIKNITNNLGLRIYSPQIKCYLLNDVNILDLTTIKLDPTTNNVLNKYQLTPLFQYQNTLIFFCQAPDDSIHLVNRHLLDYLITNKESKLFKTEFSVKVAENISQFVALFDRGLIHTNFQNYLEGQGKIVNLSGFDIFTFRAQKLPKDTKLNVINFIFDEENQAFTQTDTTDVMPKKYLALKISQDYTYKMINQKLTKFLNVSVFN